MMLFSLDGSDANSHPITSERYDSHLIAHLVGDEKHSRNYLGLPKQRC